MFSKPNKPTTEIEPAAFVEPGKRGPKVASLIAEELVIDGGLSGEVELHVDGTVRGDVKVARLTIGETGCIEGAVEAESVDCRGRVVGSITAGQVRLYGAAHVDGDITHDQLTMETGAFFQGRSLKLPRSQAEPLELTVVAAE
jgi:cytoskeletal protein CcmA (bactofilin family)